MRERYTCIHKQIDIAEHNEKYTARVIRVFYQNVTIEGRPTPHPIAPSCFSFVINRGLNLSEVCQFKDLGRCYYCGATLVDLCINLICDSFFYFYRSYLYLLRQFSDTL